MMVTWSSDFSYTRSGWAATWTVTANTGESVKVRPAARRDFKFQCNFPTMPACNLLEMGLVRPALSRLDAWGRCRCNRLRVVPARRVRERVR
jgi:hypothetical protein